MSVHEADGLHIITKRCRNNYFSHSNKERPIKNSIRIGDRNTSREISQLISQQILFHRQWKTQWNPYMKLGGHAISGHCTIPIPNCISHSSEGQVMRRSRRPLVYHKQNSILYSSMIVLVEGPGRFSISTVQAMRVRMHNIVWGLI